MFQLLKKVFSAAYKFSTVFVFVILIMYIFSLVAFKSTPSQSNDVANQDKFEIYNYLNNISKTGNQQTKIIAVIYRGANCSLIGQYCSNNPDDETKNYSASLFGSVANIISAPLSQPPASGIYWVYNNLENNGFVPNTMAYEGTGFAAIKGFLNLWLLFRNFAFLVLVIIIVIIGFMIMFRMKLNPQTVISVENALPRIVITMLLITFSFAIAGFLIDLMYSFIGIVIYILSQANIGELKPTNLLDWENRYIAAQFGELWPYKSESSAFSTGFALVNVLPMAIQAPVRGVVSYIVTSAMNQLVFRPFIKGMLSPLDNLGLQAFTFGINLGGLPSYGVLVLDIIIFFAMTGYAPGLLLGIIILFTLLFLMFKIFFMLITSYIKIILFIIFSPVILLFGAIPGKNVFGFWFRGLFAELISFPLVIIIMMVGYAIVEVSKAKTSAFVLPFLYGFNSSDFGVIIGLGLILVIPQVIGLAKQLLGVKELGLDVGVGTFLGGGAAALAGGGAILKAPALLHSLPLNWQHALRTKGPLQGIMKNILPPEQSELNKSLAQNIAIGMGVGTKEASDRGKLMK
ncbi:hypothetical protein HGA88_01180 [Candidatus Roizmanbacteria bacterium]|nr:hypothetical protein [Candidatus Roizmanbacteria bacterium]